MASPAPSDSGLDRGVPLLLLPVRLETRFQMDGKRRRLLIRVYPDHVHVDSHRPALTPAEQTHGLAFWRSAWARANDRAALEAAFSTLASRIGAYRAAWVLEATRPANWGDAGGRRGAPGPRFPAAPPAPRIPTPSMARLLPEKWIVSGSQKGEHLFTVAGTRIPGDLPVAPHLAASGAAPRGMRDLMETQGLAWLRDFQAAVDSGMALRIPLGPLFRPGKTLDVVVVGVRRGEAADAAAGALADLLAAHQWTHGMDFTRRGTPTNNTDRARSGVSLTAPDLGTLLDTVLARPDPRPSRPAPLARQPFARATRLALGLDAGSVLERVPLRDDTQLDLGAAMSAALWPATWGHFLRTMVAGAVPGPSIDWAREHFIAHVRGGGTLPALRVGPQPYGVLPVAWQARRPAAGDPVQRLENLLLDLLPAWTQAVEQGVTHLDPDATDLLGTAEPTPGSLAGAVTALSRTLGATPNPSDLLVRPVTDETETFQSAWGIAILLLDFSLGDFPDIAGPLGVELRDAATLEEQIEALEDTIAAGATDTHPMGPLYYEAHSGPDQARKDKALAAIALIQGKLLALLYHHRDRVDPVIELGPDRGEVTARMADGSGPVLFLSFLGEDTARAAWAAPLVAGDPSARDEVVAWLRALVAEADGASTPATPPASPAPLLFQLLKRSLQIVHASDRADMVAGLRTLAAAAADGRLPDPVADLETLMGEVLGTCMHRLDAWLSGAAAARLEALRVKRPRGLQIGGFGWVTGLRRALADTPSQGFIHAPTLDHAATAAIIRSGWSALGDGALGVDVSSARARAASWLVDGLRDGRGLDDLLGQSLERRLHDARLDRHVEPIRRAVLEGTGQGRRPPNAVTDGHVVARAWMGGDEVAPLTDEERQVRRELRQAVTAAGADAEALGAVLTAHAADLDAVADATLVQSVHALVRGNLDQGAAALTAVGSGDGGPAALTALATPRGGRRITHRLLALLDVAPPATDVDASTPDAAAEPSLEAWLPAVLPALGDVVYGAWITEGESRTWTGPLTLASAGLGWLELLGDLPDADGAGGGRLAARLGWRLSREAAAAGRVVSVEIDEDAGGRAAGRQLPLRLFRPAGLALRGVLRSARAADAADLSPGPSPSTANAAIVADRADALADAARGAALALRTALDDNAATPDLLDALVALARWHVPGAIPRAGLRDLAIGDASDRAALVAEAEAAHARMQKRLAARDAVTGDDVASSLARIRALVPGAIVLPPFATPDAAALEATAGRSATRLGTGAAVMPWLQQSARVRARAGGAVAAIDLVEAAAGRARFAPALLQLPDHPDEGWAATTFPAHDTGPRTCLLSITGRPKAFAAPIAGLVLDAWTEVIPDRTVTTGIAVHFDARSAEAPQALLLAVPPADGPWEEEQVLAIVRQTLDHARHRAVGPEAIQGYGQYLPAIYLGDDLDPGEPVAALSVPGSEVEL